VRAVSFISTACCNVHCKHRYNW